MDSTTYEDAAKSALILIGSLLTAIIWEHLYLAFIRSPLFRIQRWKTYAKIRYRVELLHCLKNRRTLNYPREDGIDGAARPPFSEALVFGNYLEPEGLLRTEAVSMARLITRKEDAQSRAASHSSPEATTGETVPSAEELWSEKSKKKRKGPFRRCYEDCIYGKKRNSWRDKDFKTLVKAKGAIGFAGHQWIPKEKEGRGLLKYLRGNFLNLFGSLVSVGLIVVGAVAALQQSGITFGGALTGTSLLAVAAFLKFPDFLTSAMAYFGIVCSDLLERGDIVEISSPSLATGGSRGDGLFGGVLRITWTHVHFLYVNGEECSLNYASVEKSSYLSGDGQLRPVAALFPSGQPTKGANDVEKPDAPISRVRGRKYLEKDEVRFFSNKAVSVAHVASCVVDRKVSWVPVAVLSRVSTEDFT